MAATSGWGVVLAGGKGTRFGGDTPKQFQLLGGCPVLAWSYFAIARCLGLVGVTVVVPASHCERVSELVRRWPTPFPAVVVPGGAERQSSARVGLATVPDTVDSVLIHDAARPFVSPAMVARLYDGLAVARAVIPGVPERNTLKLVDEQGIVLRTVDRKGMYEIQTPQLFHRDVIVDAHDLARCDGFLGTDDAELVERAGEPVHLVPGDFLNLKITTKRDIVLAERLVTGGGLLCDVTSPPPECAEGGPSCPGT